MASDHLVATCVLIFGMLVATGVAANITHRVLEGDRVQLTCGLTYDATKELVWFKNPLGGIIRRLEHTPPKEASLLSGYSDRTDDIRLSGPEGTDLWIGSVRRTDEATGGTYYECQQPQGENAIRHHLLVQYPPDPPTNIMLNRLSTGLTVSCMAGQSYTGSQRMCAEYQQHATSSWKQGPCQSAVEDGTAVQFEVSDLKPTQSYNVCCTAIDSFGKKETCQSTGPLHMARAPLTDGQIAAIVICACILLIAFFIFAIVYCCRKYGKEGNVCTKIPCPCLFGMKGDGRKKEGEGKDIEEEIGLVTGQGKNQLNAAMTVGTSSNHPPKEKHSRKEEEKPTVDCCNWFRTINNYHYHGRQNSSEGKTTTSQDQYRAPRGSPVKRSNSREYSAIDTGMERKSPSRNPNTQPVQPDPDGASARPSSPPPSTTVASVHAPRDGHTGAKQGLNADAMWDEVFQLLVEALPSHPQLPLALAVTLRLPEDYVNHVKNTCGSDKARLPEDYVNHVKNTCGSDKAKMLRDILDFWFERDTDPSPLTLAEALNRCKFYDVAKEVQDCWQKYNSTGLKIQLKES